MLPTRTLLAAADPVKKRQREGIPDLPLAEARSTLGWLGGQTLQAADSLLYALDTPGALVRSGVSALMGGDPGDPLGSWDDRVSGAELLEQAGLAPERPESFLGRAGKFAAGTLAEVVLDPLSMLSGPTRALTPAGHAADAAGLLRRAEQVASLKMLPQAAAGADLPATATRAVRALEKAGVPLTEAAVQSRPLVGRRAALRDLRLQDLLDDIADPAVRQQTQTRVARELARRGTDMASVADQPLARSVGVGLPLGDASAAYDVFGKEGGDLLAGAMDALGQSVRWSLPVRYGAAWTQKAVNGAWDLADQVTAIGSHRVQDAAARAADAENAQALVKGMMTSIPDSVAQATGVRSLMSPEGNAALLRMKEAIVGKTTFTTQDQLLYNSVPEVKELVDRWIDPSTGLRAKYLEDSRRWGLFSNELTDPYGTGYLPRQQDEWTLLDQGRGLAQRFDYSTMTPDQIARGEAFKVPGGTPMLRQLGADPMLAGPERLARNDQEAAQHIKSVLDPLAGSTPYSDQHALTLARALRNINPRAVKAGQTIFERHPLESVAEYTRGRAQAIATAQHKVGTLADYAVNTPSALVQKGGHVSAAEAVNAVKLHDVADATTGVVEGASARLKEAIAKRAGITDPDSIDLSQWSVPTSLIDRLNRVTDAYQMPGVQSQLVSAIDQITKVWKAATLSWPSRFSRDFYSGIISNWLETGDAVGVVRAYSDVYRLMSGNIDSFAPALADVPEYAQLFAKDPQTALRAFLSDAASSRVLTGMSVSDLPTATRSGYTALDTVPGAQPGTPLGILSDEFGPQATRSWSEFGRDALRVKGVMGATETRNPILRAGERMGDFTDGISRLSGYLTLMRQGIAPQEAAERIGRALVNYDSLTSAERGVITKILPFWAYQSRMGAYVLNHVIERPGGRYAQMMRAIHNAQEYDDDTYVPTNIREQFGYKIGGDEGGDLFLTDFDAPGLDQLNMLKIAPGGGIDTSRTLQSIGQQVAPLYRGAMEHITGTNFFYKRPLGENETGLDRLLDAATGGAVEKAYPIVNTLVSMSPLSRYDSVVRHALDPNRSVAQRALDIGVNNLTGVKERYVPRTAEFADASEKIKRAMDGFGRERPLWYVPQNQLPRLSPQQMRLYQLYSMMDSYDRKAKAAKREGRPLPPIPF